MNLLHTSIGDEWFRCKTGSVPSERAPSHGSLYFFIVNPIRISASLPIPYLSMRPERRAQKTRFHPQSLRSLNRSLVEYQGASLSTIPKTRQTGRCITRRHPVTYNQKRRYTSALTSQATARCARHRRKAHWHGEAIGLREGCSKNHSAHPMARALGPLLYVSGVEAGL